MFLFQFVKYIIETVIEIYAILQIWWVDPQYPWSLVMDSPIWGSSMTRVKRHAGSIVKNVVKIGYTVMEISIVYRITKISEVLRLNEACPQKTFRVGC